MSEKLWTRISDLATIVVVTIVRIHGESRVRGISIWRFVLARGNCADQQMAECCHVTAQVDDDPYRGDHVFAES